MSKLFARIRQLLPIYAGIWVGGLLLVFLATMIAAAFAASVAMAGHVPVVVALIAALILAFGPIARAISSPPAQYIAQHLKRILQMAHHRR